MKNNLKNQLKSAFEAPMPIGKNSFLSTFDYPKASKFEFIKSQLSYIRKRVWFLSLFLFAATLTGMYFYKVSYSFIWIISSALPFISLVSILEIVRSSTYNMEELEISCKHNLLELSLIRLGVLGASNFIVLISILLLFNKNTDFGFFRLGLYLTTPFLLNCCLSLLIINCLKSREIIYICSGITAFISILNTLVATQADYIYTEKYWIFWAIAFIISIASSAKELVKLVKKMEELQWNLQLTA